MALFGLAWLLRVKAELRRQQLPPPPRQQVFTLDPGPSPFCEVHGYRRHQSRPRASPQQTVDVPLSLMGRGWLLLGVMNMKGSKAMKLITGVPEGSAPIIMTVDTGWIWNISDILTGKALEK
ncbi:unnamed protein product [Nezara viridula]|uniref:Uncharacterized protein n=1 Tax=Nezara viridula TaxID=85310 RepID=A0A9P0HE48_NEZVI|nr:unnamed protein product [Nezara viridula]